MKYMKTIHLYYCFVLWSLWIIGMLLTIVSKFAFNHTNVALFWGMYPYNLLLLISTLLPVEPTLFIVSLIKEIPEWKKKSFLTIVLPFIITAIMWFIYISVVIGLIGGVV